MYSESAYASTNSSIISLCSQFVGVNLLLVWVGVVVKCVAKLNKFTQIPASSDFQFHQMDESLIDVCYRSLKWNCRVTTILKNKIISSSYPMMCMKLNNIVRVEGTLLFMTKEH